MKHKLLNIILLIYINIITAQNKLGTWNIINANVKINPKWNLFAEAQLRSLSFYDEFHYYEIKTGGTYKINKQFSATSGFGSYNTYNEGGNFSNPIQNKEIRTWLQINNKQSLGIVNIEHRYRAEQRFTSSGFRSRFRYRLGTIVPLNKKTITEKTLYLNIWNEIFLTNKAPYFERNRSLLGLGYELNKKVSLQAGYIYQFDYKINDETGRDFLNIAVLYNFDLTNGEKDFTPITND